MRRVNVFAPQMDEASDRAGYGWSGARLGRQVGSEQVGVLLLELAEGQRSHPYHFHHEREEWALVVAGSPSLRTPAGERTLRAGDAVCFPAGEAGAHELTGPGTVLLLSDNRAPATAEYPERGLLAAGGRVFRLADAVDLWEDT